MAMVNRFHVHEDAIDILFFDESGNSLYSVGTHTGRLRRSNIVSGLTVDEPDMDGQVIAINHQVWNSWKILLRSNDHYYVEDHKSHSRIELTAEKTQTRDFFELAVFSRDGKVLAAISRTERPREQRSYNGQDWNAVVSVWDAQTGTSLWRRVLDDNVVLSIAIAPDGSRILTGGTEGTIRLLSVPANEELLRLDNPDSSSIYSVQFAPNPASDQILGVAGQPSPG